MLEAAFPALPALLVLFGADDRCEDVWAGEGIGISAAELLGDGMRAAMSASDGDRLRALLAQARAQGRPAALEFGLARPGPARRFDARLRPLPGGEVVAFLLDVTDKRRLEEQVLQSHKLESIGRLAGGLAHDFNNLLIGILGYAQFLEEGIRQGKPDLGDLAEIRKAGERARDLTAQLLAVARRQPSEPRLVDPSAVVRDSQKFLSRLLGEDVILEVRLEAAPWTVRIDPAQLLQVIMNLAVNARDAMRGGGRLVIATENVVSFGEEGEVPPGKYALLRVSDTGEGMSSEARAHLFEPFYTTKPVGSGTGLGLATVYGIVKQAGGHVSVETELGRGTTFRVYLPRSTDDSVRTTPSREFPAPPRGREGVLVVEDDDSVRELVVRALREAGYRVVVAASGRDALEVARTTDETLHLLLTDVVMPEMGGKQLADALLVDRPFLRVIFMSGYAQDALGQNGVLDVAFPLLAKPFTPAALREKVRSVLDAV